jgi:hypothetical protein
MDILISEITKLIELDFETKETICTQIEFLIGYNPKQCHTCTAAATWICSGCGSYICSGCSTSRIGSPFCQTCIFTNQKNYYHMFATHAVMYMQQACNIDIDDDTDNDADDESYQSLIQTRKIN